LYRSNESKETPSSAGIGLQLKKISTTRSVDVLVAQLRDEIHSRAFPDGSILPAERLIAEQTGLARGAVREALRILQTEGLLKTKPGRHGGSVICRPSEDLLARHITLFALGRQIPLTILLEAREAVEPSIAALAATNRTPDELEALVALTKSLAVAVEAIPDFISVHLEWHVALATASKNALLKGFIEGIAGLTLEASNSEVFDTLEVRQMSVKAHQSILKAIAARDAATAARRMQRHHRAAIQQFLRHAAKNLGQGRGSESA
jgi:DNA-binding FadR family transcriptional regulator